MRIASLFFTHLPEWSYTGTGHKRRGENYVDELAVSGLLCAYNGTFDFTCFTAADRRSHAVYFIPADFLWFWLYAKEVRG